MNLKSWFPQVKFLSSNWSLIQNTYVASTFYTNRLLAYIMAPWPHKKFNKSRGISVLQINHTGMGRYC